MAGHGSAWRSKTRHKFMKDYFLFLAGTCSGALIFSFSCIIRELYGFHQEDKKLLCKLCGARHPDAWDEDLGSVCSECEIQLTEVGAQLVKLSEKIL